MGIIGGKSDPINESYYSQAELLEKIVFWLFIVGGVLSFALLFVQEPEYHDIMQVLFLCTSLLLFSLNHFFHLFLFPKAENKRVSDFMSAAFDISLIEDRSRGYYNNSETGSIRRAAFQLLENTFFTRSITSLMLKVIRPISIAYFLIWLPCLVYRGSDLDWLVVFSSVLFSEGVFSKWIKLEWLKHKSSAFYDDVYRILNTTDKGFDVSAIEKLIMYEKLKATASILLCSKTFNQHNERLSSEWNAIRSSLEKKEEDK